MNALQRINRLPDELVVEIFQLAFINTPHPSVNKARMNIARVQSRWWRLLISYPAFWTTMYFRDHPEIVKVKLERSRQSPLDVDIGERYDGIDESAFFSQVRQWI